MDYPHPNPHFPPPPRKGAAPWGWVALVVFLFAVGSLLYALLFNEDTTKMATGLACTLGGMITVGLAFTRHARTGGWRSARIVPAVIYADAGNRMQPALVDSWWKGKPQRVEIPPGRFWETMNVGDFVWIIQPTNFTTAQFIEVAATDKHCMTPVPPEAQEWLMERLQRK